MKLRDSFCHAALAALLAAGLLAQNEQSVVEGVGPWNADFRLVPGSMYLLDFEVSNNTTRNAGSSWKVECDGADDEACGSGVFFQGIAVEGEDSRARALLVTKEPMRCGVYVELRAGWTLRLERRDGDRAVEAMFNEQTRQANELRKELGFPLSADCQR